jgi:hypothetical protein
MKSVPGLLIRADELRSKLRVIEPLVLCTRTGSDFINAPGETSPIRLALFGASVAGSFPELIFSDLNGNALPDFLQLLLLYYFETADGYTLTGNYISFADLPGGRIYYRAFQGYSGDVISKYFGDDIEALKKSCEDSNGQPLNIADLAFTFQILPKMSVQLIYWIGDDEFPSSCKILFDAAVTHYLPIDACAIVGSNIVKRIIGNHSKI